MSPTTGLQARRFNLREADKHTLGHELAHVFCGHLDVENPDRAAQEKEADQKAWDYFDAYTHGKL